MILKTSAIIIVLPGRFQESIQILLASISQIDQVFSVATINEALSLATIITPAIVILDYQAARHDPPTALKQIDEAWHGINRIVVVEDEIEAQQATVHGADLVLLKGFTASKLVNEIEKILKII